MRAVWYDRQGPAAEVLQVGELPDPRARPRRGPGPRHALRGQPRRHEEAARLARLVDAVPAGDPAQRRRRRHRRRRRRRRPRRVGQRVWVYGAQSYRPFGTAAAVHRRARRPGRRPARRRVRRARRQPRASPASPPTAPSSPTARSTARPSWCTASSAASAPWPPSSPAGAAPPSSAPSAAAPTSTGRPTAVAHAVALDQSDPAAAIRAYAPDGVDRIIEVALSDNVDLDAAVAAERHRHRRLRHPRRPPRDPLLADAVQQRHHPAARQRRLPRRGQAAGRRRPHRRGRDGALSIAVGDPLPLDRIAEAHDRVDAGTRERVLLAVDN